MRVRRALPLAGLLSCIVDRCSATSGGDAAQNQRGDSSSQNQETGNGDLRRRRKSTDREPSARDSRSLRALEAFPRDSGGEGDEILSRYLRLFDWTQLSVPTVAPAPPPSRRPNKRTHTPSIPPTRSPTNLRPSGPPTGIPEPPTPPPNQTPPTLAPSIAPVSDSPTRLPTTLQPSESPTLRLIPTSLPTPSPAVTGEPTVQPSSTAPTTSPTGNPVAIPTVTPTEPLPCSVNLTSTCIDCEGNTIIDPVCQGAPTRLLMKYTGGGCNQTKTNQQIPCFDFQGGPSSEAGSQGFVVVTFQDTIYHQAWVTVGSQYTIQDSTGAVLGAPQSIVVYQSEDQNPSNVLQSLVFDGSCSETLPLLDQFGASQVVGFTVDGNTTRASFNATIELEISVTSGPELRLETLVVSSSEGVFDVSGQIEGSTLSAGETDTASFTVNLDLTIPRLILFLSNLTATNVDDPTLGCSAESFLSIPVGPADDVAAGNFVPLMMRGPF